MPTSRKELIFQTIQEYTSKAIVENNLDFSSCNAHILSLNLHIDRSNISRILNQLFQEGKLITVVVLLCIFLGKSLKIFILL